MISSRTQAKLEITFGRVRIKKPVYIRSIPTLGSIK